MDIQTPELSPSPSEFDDILEATIEDAVPASQGDTPERRARRLSQARRQFAAFCPSDAAEAQLAAFAVAAMMGAIDSIDRAALPGVGGESTGRLRGNALATARFYKSTLHSMRTRRLQDAEHEARTRAVAAKKPELPPKEFEPIPELEVFQPRDRRGKPIPKWRHDLLTRKQKLATYNPHDRAAWDIAREEEDAAIAEQAILDAQAGITETDPADLLPVRAMKPNV